MPLKITFALAGVKPVSLSPVEALLPWVCGGVVVGAEPEDEVPEMVGRHVHLHLHVLPRAVPTHDDPVGVAAAGLVGPRTLVPGVAADAALAAVQAVLVLRGGRGGGVSWSVGEKNPLPKTTDSALQRIPS